MIEKAKANIIIQVTQSILFSCASHFYETINIVESQKSVSALTNFTDLFQVTIIHNMYNVNESLFFENAQ